jgi:hypothetical protein
MVRVGRRTAQTIIYATGDQITTEVGRNHRLLFVDNVLLEYENEPPKDFWRWTTITAFGYFGDGSMGHVSWRYGKDADVPAWAIGLAYGYVPEHRRVR